MPKNIQDAWLPALILAIIMHAGVFFVLYTTNNTQQTTSSNSQKTDNKTVSPSTPQITTTQPNESEKIMAIIETTEKPVVETKQDGNTSQNDNSQQTIKDNTKTEGVDSQIAQDNLTESQGNQPTDKPTSTNPSSSSQAATQVIKVWWFARMPLYRQYYYLCRYNPDTGCQIAGLGLQNYR